MKKIEIVKSFEQEEYLNHLWKTKEFIHLSQNHTYFKLLKQKLKKSSLFFFEIENEKARNHLTSIFRCIAHRKYENPYIHDLYYFHEFCHCAHYIENSVNSYDEWAIKLSENELYASLMSEAFIYFMDNTLLDKTFPNLWVNRFIKDEQIKDSLGFYINQTPNDKYYLFQVKNNEWNPFNLELVWPDSIKDIIRERRFLRTVDSLENLDEASKIIVNYNKSHQIWIKKWDKHYHQIDKLLFDLNQRNLNDIDFINIILENCDSYGRAFFPK